jgi:hypothetical protein
MPRNHRVSLGNRSASSWPQGHYPDAEYPFGSAGSFQGETGWNCRKVHPQIIADLALCFVP